MFGQFCFIRLTLAKNAGFVGVPLYVYNAAAKEQAEYDAGTYPGVDAGEGLPGTLSRPSDDLRLVFAVPQGNLGVQIAEVATYSATLRGTATMEPLPPEQCPAMGEGLQMLCALSQVIRGEASHAAVMCQKDGEPAVLRRLKPLQVFPTKRAGVARHSWPLVVLCDDLDKGEPGKTFLLGRMVSVSIPAPPEPLTEEEAAGIPF